MVLQDDYRNSLIAAVALHILLIIMLCFEASSNQPPVLTKTASTSAAPAQQSLPDEQHAIQAVSVNQNEVMQTMNRLKQERLNQQRAEQSRQRALQQQAEAARQQRLKEQNRLAALQREAAQLAVTRAKQLAEEQQRVKKLEELKHQEEQHRIAMQKQQQEMQKLAELKQKEEQAKKVALAQKAAQKSAQQAAQNAAKEAQMAGEVNKYKAMILSAIGRQWILPENANSALSSQFRIRLAPNGAVLSVALLRSSGDPILDRSAQSAIYKASPLPVPQDVAVFNLFRDINLTVRPVNARA